MTIACNCYAAIIQELFNL